jgi:prepilin signal peptidase PulO-like enzyme (type II secretory pathway)
MIVQNYLVAAKEVVDNAIESLVLDSCLFVGYPLASWIAFSTMRIVARFGSCLAPLSFRFPLILFFRPSHGYP